MKYFTMTELCKSTTAAEKNIDNTPTASAAKNLTALVDYVLDPLREAFGKPIYVNSGFRSTTLNKAVGGVVASMHLIGLAADITSGSREGNIRLYQLAQKLNLPYFELIGKKYDYAWIHISYNHARIKRNPS